MKPENRSYSSVASRLFTLFILLASLLVMPKAQAAVGDSFTKDGLKYTIQAEGQPFQMGTVSVQAESTDLSGDIAIPASVLNEGIKYSVTHVPTSGFQDCSNLTSIVITRSITEIGGNAFWNCSNLEFVYFEGNAPKLTGGYAFYYPAVIYRKVRTRGWTNSWSGCPTEEWEDWIIVPPYVGTTFTRDGLKYVIYTKDQASGTGTVAVLPESKEISGDIVIPGTIVHEDTSYSVTTLFPNAFQGCSGLTSVEIPDSINYIGEYAFQDCSSLTSIVIPNGVTAIAKRTFNRCTILTNVTLPESLTSIGEWAFSGCDHLTRLEIPRNLTQIGDKAFYPCVSLKSITLPKCITSIGASAFEHCVSLTNVYFRGNAPEFVGENAFDNPTVIYYRAGTAGWTNPWSGRPTEEWISAPEITYPPQSQSVMGGDPVNFSVDAEGTEHMSYQWYKNGFAIMNATNTCYAIARVTGRDLGNYTVVVSNELGETTSMPATLTLSQPYRATAKVYVINGHVLGVVVNDGGWGYTRAPKIRIKDETGTGATGHCVIENGMVTQIIIDYPGSNYSGEATILIGSPISNSALEIAVTEVKVKMHLVLGSEYQLWSSIDNVNWEQVGEPFTAEEEEMDILFKVEDQGRFFKLQEI